MTSDTRSSSSASNSGRAALRRALALGAAKRWTGAARKCKGDETRFSFVCGGFSRQRPVAGTTASACPVRSTITCPSHRRGMALQGKSRRVSTAFRPCWKATLAEKALSRAATAKPARTPANHDAVSRGSVAVPRAKFRTRSDRRYIGALEASRASGNIRFPR